MHFLLESIDFTLPFTNPVLKFLLILIIILITPIILNKIKVPHLLGLIIAGAIIGTNGLNLIERDSSIILSGTAGLLYIMFLAGLEIDLGEFKKNSKKSITFGLLTFSIPMTLGIITGIYVLNFSVLTSILLASMFASHTLIAYPLISKLGIAKNKVVNITVGGTLITDTLALLVLAVIVGLTKGEMSFGFWVQLLVSLSIFAFIVLIIFPIISKWFFKHFNDNVTQYIFVLVIVFLGAILAELAGIEAIIGAFLAGLSLNKLIPHTSALMNRIDFVGNAIFIPFFLIGVGMLIDYRVFFKDENTIIVATVMTIVATLSKYLAALFTQKIYKFSKDERSLIFGLSNAQAAATLAAVLVGYNIILGTESNGEPIRLLNESVLNGTILMILVTCTIASFAAQKGAKKIILKDINSNSDNLFEDNKEKILISLSNLKTIDDLINLGIAIKSKKSKDSLYGLSIVNIDPEVNSSESYSEKLLTAASNIASSTDNNMQPLIRYDFNIINGITSVVKEKKISYLILGLHIKQDVTDSFLGNLTEGVLQNSNTTTLVYKPTQGLQTIKRHLIIMPLNAEKEIGFLFWLIKVWNLAKNSGAKLIFYGNENSLTYIKEIYKNANVDAAYKETIIWDHLETLETEIKPDDNLIFIMSRKDKISYHDTMNSIHEYIHNKYTKTSMILLYPMQMGVLDYNQVNLNNPTFYNSIEKLEELKNSILKKFQ